MKHWKSRLWTVLPLFCVLAAVGVTYIVVERSRAAVPECTEANAQVFRCWQKRYQKMVAVQSPQEALADAQAAYSTVPYVKTNCHQIAHVIGRAAAVRYGDIADAYARGNDFCWSGYYHGVMETVAKDMGQEKVLAQINTICASLKNSKEFSFAHFNCMHGLGHGLMAVMNDDLFAALKVCDRLEGSWQQQSCQGGVFMENVMTEVNQGTDRAYLKQDDPLYPCTAVDDAYKQQCYLMQTSHALRVVQQDYQKVFALCASVPTYDATCYESLGRDISGNSSSDSLFTRSTCESAPSDLARTQCIQGAAKDFVAYHHSDMQANELCRALTRPDDTTTCLQTVRAFYATF